MKSCRRRSIKNKNTRKIRRVGGKTFASSNPVKITYDGSPILCDVCKHDTYIETIGSLNKSKVRSGLGQFVLGDAAEILDTTSIRAFFCKQCGRGLMFRNTDEYENKIVLEEMK